MHCLETLSWPFDEQQPEAVALKETKVEPCLTARGGEQASLLCEEESLSIAVK